MSYIRARLRGSEPGEALLIKCDICSLTECDMGCTANKEDEFCHALADWPTPAMHTAAWQAQPVPLRLTNLS